MVAYQLGTGEVLGSNLSKGENFSVKISNWIYPNLKMNIFSQSEKNLSFLYYWHYRASILENVCSRALLCNKSSDFLVI